MKTWPRCRAYDHSTDRFGAPIGDCGRFKGHPGRHVEMREGKIWAEWSGQAGYWDGEPPVKYREASVIP